MLRRGREVHSWTDYILGTDRHLLTYMVLGCLYGAMSTAHSKYLSKRKRFPLNPLKTPGGVENLFVELRGFTTKPPRRERPRLAWTSLETWQLINTRIAVCRIQDGYQGIVWTLIRKIKVKIQ